MVQFAVSHCTIKYLARCALHIRAVSGKLLLEMQPRRNRLLLPKAASSLTRRKASFRTRLALPSPCGLPAEAAYMAEDLRYVKGLARFNYWDNPDINPLLMPDMDRNTI